MFALSLSLVLYLPLAVSIALPTRSVHERLLGCSSANQRPPVATGRHGEHSVRVRSRQGHHSPAEPEGIQPGVEQTSRCHRRGRRRPPRRVLVMRPARAAPSARQRRLQTTRVSATSEPECERAREGTTLCAFTVVGVGCECARVVSASIFSVPGRAAGALVSHSCFLTIPFCSVRRSGAMSQCSACERVTATAAERASPRYARERPRAARADRGPRQADYQAG